MRERASPGKTAARLLWTLAARNVLGLGVRSLLAVAGVGVAAVVVVLSHAVYTRTVVALNHHALALNGGDLSVTTLTGPQPVEDLEPAFALKERGVVTRIALSLSGQAWASSPAGQALAYVRGIVPGDYPLVPSPDVLEPAGVAVGGLLRSESDCVLKVNLARRLGVGVGDRVRILSLQEGVPVELWVAGLAEPFNERQGDMSLRGFAFVTYERALATLGYEEPMFTEAFLTVAPGQDVLEIAEALRRSLPFCEVLTPSEAVRARGAGLQVWEVLLLVLVIACTGMAALSVNGTVHCIAARMKLDLAVIKAVGGSPSHLVMLFGFMALQLGGTGGLVGSLAGCGVVGMLSPLLRPVLGFPVGSIPLWQSGAVGFGLALTVALGSAVAPALVARSIPPVRLLRPSEEGAVPVAAIRWASAALVLSGCLLLALATGRPLSAVAVLLAWGAYSLAALVTSRLLSAMARTAGRGATIRGLAVRLLPRDAGAARILVLILLTTLLGGAGAWFVGGLQGAVQTAVATQFGSDIMLTVSSVGCDRVTEQVMTVRGVTGVRGLHTIPVELHTVQGGDFLPALQSRLREDPVLRSWLATANGFSLAGITSPPPPQLIQSGRTLTGEDRGRRRLLVLDLVANALGIVPGQTVGFDISGVHHQFEVVGVVRRQMVSFGSFITTEADVRAVAPGRYPVLLNIAADDGRPTAEVICELQRAVPEGIPIPVGDILQPFRRTTSAAVTIFAVLLAILAAGNVMSVADSVSLMLEERRWEWAVIKAVGAAPAQTVGLSLWYYLTIAGLGIVTGAAGAAILGAVLLYGMSGGAVAGAVSAAGLASVVLAMAAVVAGTVYAGMQGIARRLPAEVARLGVPGGQ
ncbi:MAG: hypothetical protein K6T75_01060 [Acetobacteraceae bacterium]|nr:hypothetical protein [Acetobacteraceae bacterium]